MRIASAPDANQHPPDAGVTTVRRTTSTKSRAPSRALARCIVGVAAAVGSFVLVSPAASTVQASDDWLTIVNTYRAQSGLPPVTENASWSAGAMSHSCWMLRNGIAHDEPAGTPGYTSEGDAAGNSGNVAVSSSASATTRSHVDLWMTGPFHAIGILRASFRQSGYGKCTSPPNPTAGQWNSAATLD